MALKRAQLQRAIAVLGSAPGDELSKVIFTVVSKGTQFGVTVKLHSTSGADEVEICDAVGKIKTYTAVDDFITAATKATIINSGSPIAYEFSNVAALEPAVFTGDIVAKTKRTIAAYVKQSVAAAEDITTANTVIALLPASTSGEIAYKAEKTAQRDSVIALKAWLDAEVIRLTALLPVVTP